MITRLLLPLMVLCLGATACSRYKMAPVQVCVREYPSGEPLANTELSFGTGRAIGEKPPIHARTDSSGCCLVKLWVKPALTFTVRYDMEEWSTRFNHPSVRNPEVNHLMDTGWRPVGINNTIEFRILEVQDTSKKAPRGSD